MLCVLLSAPPPARHFLSVLCWHWVPWAGFCGQEPFSFSSVGEALPSLSSLSYSPLLGRGWLGKRARRGRRELGAGVHVWYKESSLAAFSLRAPFYLSLPRISSVTQALCVLLAREGGGARWEGGWEGEMVTAGLIPGP